MLHYVVIYLDSRGIDYHLEGGTLLGLVRDQELIEWDFDLDLSIRKGSADKVWKGRYLLWFKGYRLTMRRSRISYGPILCDDIRLFKVKSIFWSLIAIFSSAVRKNLLVTDIFIKFSDGRETFWIAKDRVMKAPSIHYSGQETVSYQGFNYSVPVDYRGYLTHKYGKWHIPVKEWNCADDEKTVVAGVRH